MKNALGKLGGRLAARAPAPEAAISTPAAVPGNDIVHGKRRRGAGDIVCQTVRLARKDWVTMTEIKMVTGLSAQEQFLEALTMWFDHQGKAAPGDSRRGQA